MEVHFTPEQEARLAEIATTARVQTREGIAQADRGEFIEEEEMDVRLEQMLLIDANSLDACRGSGS